MVEKLEFHIVVVYNWQMIVQKVEYMVNHKLVHTDMDLKTLEHTFKKIDRNLIIMLRK